MTIQEQIKLIEQWAIDRGLDKNGTVEGQLIKTAEEVSELIIAISKDDRNGVKDAIGDIFVTLVVGNMIDKHVDMSTDVEDIINTKVGPDGKFTDVYNINKCLSQLLFKRWYQPKAMNDLIYAMARVWSNYSLKPTDCIESAYKEIAGRKGKVIDGTFIKESALDE